MEVLGEKIGQKIFNEIENSKTTTFATFLSALSIPLIGDTASKKIGSVTNSLNNIDIACDQVKIGPKAKENLYDWLTENSDWHLLFDYFTFQEVKKVAVQDKGNVCITGKLNDFSNRAKAKECLEGYGYTVTTTVSRKTDYLVCEDGSTSSKSKKAESLEIPIVTIDSLIN